MAAVNEDPTKELPGASPFEQRVLAELAALRSEVGDIRGEVGGLRAEVDGVRVEVGGLRSEVAEVRAQQMAMAKHFVALVQRLTSLEERVDNRLKETRPIWEAVRTQIEKLDEKFNVFIRDIYDVRGDIGGHEKRLGVLERRILS
jgi:predicted  nucleic acid-binding Zn-ribbon protein